jgi:hypothetical protein
MFATDSSFRNGASFNSTSYALPRFCVVSGTEMTSVLGESGSSRERMTTGRTLAARLRSANQTSPGFGFLQHVEDFLLDLP